MTTRIKTAALVALAITAGAVLLAVGVVLPALREAEAERGLQEAKAAREVERPMVGDFYGSPGSPGWGTSARGVLKTNEADDPLAGLDVLADEVAKPQTGEP